MKKTSIMLAAALSLATVGCKKKGADCEKAIANGLELSKATMAKMGVDDTARAKMRELGVKKCQDDKWSEDALTCMTDAKSEAEAQGCYGKLTPDQQAKMNKAAKDLTPPAGAGAGSAAGSGSAAGTAPTGGSNTAGSAAAP